MIKKIGVIVFVFVCLPVNAQQPEMTMMDHSHLPIEVPVNITSPQLSLTIYPDSMGGYNLLLDIEGYHFIPPPNKKMDMAELMAPSVNKNTGFVEGHAHLYVNGVKIQRLYAKALHLPQSLFKPGLNQLTISLNNHGHMYWTVNNKQVLASLFFKDDGEPTIIYQFESFPVDLDQ